MAKTSDCMGWQVDAVWSVGHHMTLFKGQIMSRLKMGRGGGGGVDYSPKLDSNKQLPQLVLQPLGQ